MTDKNKIRKISNAKTSNVTLSFCFILQCFLNMVTRQLHAIKVNVWLLHLGEAVIPPRLLLFLKMYTPRLSWILKFPAGSYILISSWSGCLLIFPSTFRNLGVELANRQKRSSDFECFSGSGHFLFWCCINYLCQNHFYNSSACFSKIILPWCFWFLKIFSFGAFYKMVIVGE